MENRRRILCVGLACIDVVTTCQEYPKEDTDQRCLEQHWSRGGNASNTASVISILPTPCFGSFMGTLARTQEMRIIERDLEENCVAYDSCIYRDICDVPMSVVIVNIQNGSRTILHSNKNLTELSSIELCSFDIESSDIRWIHLEGRSNVEAQIEFLKKVTTYNEKCSREKQIRTSVELEKPRQALVALMDQADVVFVSKEHAQFRGCKNKEEAVKFLLPQCNTNATLIVPWGEEGAVACVRKADGSTDYNCILSAPIYPPEKVVDTLGAGDSFIAGVLSALSMELPLERALHYGCQVAGAKCGMQGFRDLKNMDNLCLP